MGKPVTTQQLGMDLLLVVILQNIGIMIFWNGANNYFPNQFSHNLALQPIAMSSQKSIKGQYGGAPDGMKVIHIGVIGTMENGRIQTYITMM